jgi:diguanylate cyclase (GGDEF)-like protein
MTPVLDIRTLVLIYVGIRIGQAVVLVYLWSVQRNYPPAKDWAIGALMSAAGLFLFSLRGISPVWVSEVLSNVLLLPGWMIFDYGIVRAAGRKPPVRLGVALCAVALASLTWNTVVSPNYAAGVVTQNLFFVGFDLYAAYACLRVSEAGRTVTFRLIGILLVLLVTACTWRMAGGVFGMPLSFAPTTPRLFWIAASLVTFPMITTLLTLHTSQRLQEEINDQALHDTLTGAYNRRAFDVFANRKWPKAMRHGYPFSVLMVDVDHFKQFNDQHGHQTGDDTLVRVSRSAQTVLRANDIWCRYGGEEFVALLPNTTLEQAVLVAERLRSAVEKTAIATPSGLLGVSVSIGVAERPSPESSWADVLAASDAALYKAKAAGRNRVVAGEGTVPATAG